MNDYSLLQLIDDLQTPVFTLLGTLFGGLISYFLQRQRFSQELRIMQEAHKVEFMAESTVKHFLNHKSFTDRSFETLKKNIGGFEDDELRKILVRAGAIRTYRKDGSEWWRLLSRMDEYIDNKQTKAGEQ